MWAGLLLLVVILGGQPHPSWARVMLIFTGLGFVAEGVYALRTGKAEFGIRTQFKADRWQKPVRFWLFSMLNFGLGGWLLVVEMFSPGS